MRKNGSRFISFKQYRATDMFVFALILVAAELLLFYANSALYNGGFQINYSPLVLIVALVMMRWGWPAVFYAVGDGVLHCLLLLGNENFDPRLFAVYAVGNAVIMLLLVLLKWPGKRKIAEKWYFSALFVVLGWILVVLGRTTVAVCCGYNFVGNLLVQLTDLLSLGVALVLVLVFRRIDGMFEDQKTYLFRRQREREEEMRPDDYGDEPIEITEDTLSILRKRDDELE